jgi:predicted ATP-binding protein involved in virulence
MIIFENIKWKNFLSTGNLYTEIDFKKSNTTIVVGKNGSGKCFSINTKVRLRNKNTGEIIETTVGEFYGKQKGEE